MVENNSGSGQLVTFLRKRDYVLVRELGRGACGATVLLHDEQINENFVCKKYAPYDEEDRAELFQSFIREIKLLHKVLHRNVVRIFNYYLYPSSMMGYILMEFIDGQDVDDYLAGHPEQINEVFMQAVGGFGHLEKSKILHRDIRGGNVMVDTSGVVKIIDLGFGKHIERGDDFHKSISVNSWCEAPFEFGQKRYDFGTEVYFVGNLFRKILNESGGRHFKYADVLDSMCQRDPSKRTKSFVEVETAIQSRGFAEIDFDESSRRSYREFSEGLCEHIGKLERNLKYVSDVDRIKTELGKVYKKTMLEDVVPDARVVLKCFIDGKYYYNAAGLRVPVVKEFLMLLQSASDAQARVIVANLHAKFDSIPRYEARSADDVPF